MEDQIIDAIIAKKEKATVIIYTLGRFEVWIDKKMVSPKAWKRDKALQLLQFLLITGRRKAMHKEQIIDRLWEDDMDDHGFKVALHGINKVLEPNKKSHADPQYITRNVQTYSILIDDIWVDCYAFEDLVSFGIHHISIQPMVAEAALREALKIHRGSFLPERVYEDWSADERERLQLMYLNACISLAEITLESNPTESIQHCQAALLTDITWEDAYRIQMDAFYKKGNRPMAIKTYKVCEKVLWEEMALRPLPETKRLFEKITAE